MKKILLSTVVLMMPRSGRVRAAQVPRVTPEGVGDADGRPDRTFTITYSRLG